MTGSSLIISPPECPPDICLARLRNSLDWCAVVRLLIEIGIWCVSLSDIYKYCCCLANKCFETFRYSLIIFDLVYKLRSKNLILPPKRDTSRVVLLPLFANEYCTFCPRLLAVLFRTLHLATSLCTKCSLQHRAPGHIYIMTITTSACKSPRRCALLVRYIFSVHPLGTTGRPSQLKFVKKWLEHLAAHRFRDVFSVVFKLRVLYFMCIQCILLYTGKKSITWESSAT